MDALAAFGFGTRSTHLALRCHVRQQRAHVGFEDAIANGSVYLGMDSWLGQSCSASVHAKAAS